MAEPVNVPDVCGLKKVYVAKEDAINKHTEHAAADVEKIYANDARYQGHLISTGWWYDRSAKYTLNQFKACEHNADLRFTKLMERIDPEGRAAAVAAGAAAAQNELQKAAKALSSVGTTMEITSKSDEVMTMLQQQQQILQQQQQLLQQVAAQQQQMQDRMVRLEQKGCCIIQ